MNYNILAANQEINMKCNVYSWLNLMWLTEQKTQTETKDCAAEHKTIR